MGLDCKTKKKQVNPVSEAMSCKKDAVLRAERTAASGLTFAAGGKMSGTRGVGKNKKRWAFRRFIDLLMFIGL